MTDHEHAPTSARLNQAIAAAVVRSHRRTVGRGPTTARAFYRHNIIAVVMRAALTRGERTLLADGKQELVRRFRDELQRTMRDDLVREIERLTACKVVALMSATGLDPDVSAEVFVLDRPISTEPRPAVTD